MQTNNNYNRLNKQIFPLIDEIIFNNPINSTLKFKKTLSLESKCSELIKEIIKDCEYNKEHKVKRSNALFNTTYLDRATICQSLNKLSLHVKTLKLSSRVKIIFPEFLIHLIEKFEGLRLAIKSCEAIKAKHINERSSFNAFPTDIQIKIITLSTEWPKFYNFLEGLKKLYTLDETLLYRNILPLLINRSLFDCRNIDQEFIEIAPHLKSIDVTALLLNRLKINAKQLSSAQSIKIHYQDFISLHAKETYPGEFAEEIDEEIFQHLGSLPQIEKIELTGADVYIEDSLLSLKKLTNLHTLSLNVLDNSNFTIFSHLTSLQTLKLGLTAENHELAQLGNEISRMTHLKNLYLDLRTEKLLTIKDLRLLVMPHLENLNICYGSYKLHDKSYDSDPHDLSDFLKKECPNTNIFLKIITNKASNSLSIAGIEEFKEILKVKYYS